MKSSLCFGVFLNVLRLNCCFLVDNFSIFAKDNAGEQYMLGLEKMNQLNFHSAFWAFQTSIGTFPQYKVAERLTWLSGMVGNSTGYTYWDKISMELLTKELQSDSTLFDFRPSLTYGIHAYYNHDSILALQYYNNILTYIPTHEETLFHKGVTLQNSGAINEAAECYYTTLYYHPLNVKSILNLAVILHKFGKISDALPLYKRGVEITESLMRYHTDSNSNLYNSENSNGHISNSNYLHNEYIMLKSNLGAAYLQLGMLSEAYNTCTSLIATLHQTIFYTCNTDTVTADTSNADATSTINTHIEHTTNIQNKVQNKHCKTPLHGSLSSAQSILANIQRASNNWVEWEVLHHMLLVDTLAHSYSILETQYSNTNTDTNTNTVNTDTNTALSNANTNSKITFQGPLLPFDTLLLPLTLSTKLIIAQAQSSVYDVGKVILWPLSYALQQSQSKLTQQDTKLSAHIINSNNNNNNNNNNNKQNRKLRLGFISTDFNNHPTAHLVEAIFNITHKLRTQHTHVNTSQNTQDNSTHNQYNNIELIIFNYGSPNDNSTYRINLQNLATHFIHISHLSHTDASKLITHHQIDILLDLQIHTLGHRLEITALHPAPLQINYLVFPGTSGSLFFEYLICDSIVVPVEHSQFYSESLLILPASYQLSFYDRYVSAYVDTTTLPHTPLQITQITTQANIINSVQTTIHDITTDNITNSITSNTTNNTTHNTAQNDTLYQQQLDDVLLTTRYEYRMALRRLHGLSHFDTSTSVVFCNFNKIDKIDPESYTLWMAILRRVPNAILWLLEPSTRSENNEPLTLNTSTSTSTTTPLLRNTVVKNNLCSAALHLGVSCERILFASREYKNIHIQRHAACDLFLDTIVYGAHSTATDALRGGLPVLTLLGNSFPSRVVASLYNSLRGDTLTSSSSYTASNQGTATSDGVRYTEVTSFGDTTDGVEGSVKGSDWLESVLVTHSTRQFEDTAVRLVSTTSNTTLLHSLRVELAHSIHEKRGIFNSTNSVKVFLLSMMSVHEVKFMKDSGVLRRSETLRSPSKVVCDDYHVVLP